MSRARITFEATTLCRIADIRIAKIADADSDPFQGTRTGREERPA